MTAVESDRIVTGKSLAVVEAPQRGSLPRRPVRPRHRGAANAYYILTGGGPEAWIKQERNLRMFGMIAQVVVFLATLAIKELVQHWAERQFERS